MLQPEDLARAVVFLSSADAAMIVGQILVVDGGYGLPAMGEIFGERLTRLRRAENGEDPQMRPQEDRLLPQPETREPRLHNPGIFDLSRRDLAAIMQRAGRSALADQITDSAAALAYYTFLAIPATLLVGIGVFGLVASPSDVTSLMQRLRGHGARRGDHARAGLAHPHHAERRGEPHRSRRRLRARPLDALGRDERAHARRQLGVRASRDARVRPPADHRPRS